MRSSLDADHQRPRKIPEIQRHFRLSRLPGAAPHQNQPENLGPDATEIGDDVWIGQDVLIKQGITIGTGSVVLKDVAPYEIVGGVPAKRIRFRFDTDTIALLLKSQCWRLGIPQHPQLPWNDPAAFVAALQDPATQAGLTPFDSDRGAIRDIIRQTD